MTVATPDRVFVPGPAGANGSSGSNGTDGKTVRSGSGAPSAGLGVDGDFYINTSANTIYGPKTSGAWGSPVSLVGPTGATGSAGATGAAGPNAVSGSTTTALTGLLSANGSVVGSVNGDLVYDPSEISITGATTATVGRRHVCSGTSADYTVTLPTAVGNTGRLIAFRMSNALTKLVTLDGNSTETIDGSLTRIMWAVESCVLISDGSQWCKIGGQSRSMSGGVCRTTAQSGVVTSTATKCNCNVEMFNSGGIADAANGRLIAKRPGVWSVTALLLFGNGSSALPFGTAGDLTTYIYRAGVNFAAAGHYGAAASNIAPGVVANISVSTGDTVELYGYHLKGSNASFWANSDQNCQITALEEPTW